MNKVIKNIIDKVILESDSKLGEWFVSQGITPKELREMGFKIGQDTEMRKVEGGGYEMIITLKLEEIANGGSDLDDLQNM